jgi:hypothetical protein
MTSRIAIAVGTALALAGLPTDAQAQGRTEHTKFPVTPYVWATDAGVVCDFAYQMEVVGGTVNRIRFYDADGNRIRAILTGEETIRHTNLETGFTLEETLHLMIYRDFVTGEEMQTGNFWHARTEDGKLVLVANGRTVVDLWTGELLEATPKLGSGFAQTICPALGGAAAP